MAHKYKKYIVFEWDRYYPGGGPDGDVTGDYDTPKEARASIGGYDFAEIVDRDTWEIVHSE